MVLDVEEHFTDELHLFFQFLGRKVLANVDLENPLEAIFYQQVQSVVNEYWKEYEDIFSHYVDEGAIIGDVFYDILLGESKDHAKQFNVTKSKNNKRQFLDNNIISSETKELWAPNTKVAEHLDKYKFEATEKVKARVTDEINNILGEAYREGWGHRDVAEKIQQRFTDLSTYESRRIAQTEINTTRNMVQYDRLQLDGMEYKIWHSAHDTRTRKSHLKVDEEIVPINERFSNDLMYPGDKSGDISEWVNCRCSHAAYIMPLGYEAPSFWPFTESDLVKVGSSLSKDYVSDIQERIRLIDGAMVREHEETTIEKPEPVTPPVVKPKPKKPKAKPKPKPEPTVNVDRMSSNELYESMTKADKKKYDKAKQSIDNIKKTIPVGDPLFKPMTDKYFKTIRDLEAKQKQKLMKKATAKKPKKETKKLTKAQQKELETLKQETPLNDFDKVKKWADKRTKGKIEYAYTFDTKTGKIVGEEIRGGKAGAKIPDEGPDYGSLHIHTDDLSPWPSNGDIKSYRSMSEKDHYILSSDEVWYVHADENFGLLGAAMQPEIDRIYDKCIKEGTAIVEKKMRAGKVGLDEASIKKAADKEIGDLLLKEFSKPKWKKKGLTVRRAYR